MATDTMPRTPRTVPGRGQAPKAGPVTAPRHTRPARPVAAPRPGSRTPGYRNGAPGPAR